MTDNENKAPYITKGTKVTFSFFKKTDDFASLAGAMLKFEAKHISGEGIVRNIWADDPYGKVNLRFNVELEDGTLMEIPSKGINGVANEEGKIIRVKY